MNKLKKAPASPQGQILQRWPSPSSGSSTSATLRYAQQGIESIYSPGTSLAAARSTPTLSAKSAVGAGRPTQQYWAQRALTAETLLIARSEYQREISQRAYVDEQRRLKEIAALQEGNRNRLEKSERLVVLLLCLIAGLVLFLMYLAVNPTHANRGHKSRVSHFTIPILSPFASVVEHELSVIGSKTITACLAILAALAYFVIRFWYPHLRLR